MVQQNRSSALTATVSSLIQKHSINRRSSIVASSYTNPKFGLQTASNISFWVYSANVLLRIKRWWRFPTVHGRPKANYWWDYRRICSRRTQKSEAISQKKVEKLALEMEMALISKFTWTSKWRQSTWVRDSQRTLFTMLDQMLWSLFSSTSQRTEWILKEINGLYVKLVSYVPIRRSSYLGFPSGLQSMNCLPDIRNRDHHNCFLNCYVAAWHFAYAQSLYENVCWRMKTNPETYSPSYPMTNQTVGDFEMPMGFNQSPRFENLKSPS